MGDHEGFCVKSLKSKLYPVDVPITENFDFSAALESVYPLLEIIFRFLNYAELKICCQVKKSWEEVAENVLQRRIKPSWFTCFSTKSKPSSIIFNKSNNLNYNNVGMGIILYDYRLVKLNKFICVHMNTAELCRKSVPEYLEDEFIPQNVEYCLISCRKVLSHFESPCKHTNEITISKLDGLFIPKIPKIRTAMFHCNPVKKDKIQETVDLYIKSNEEVKCLLIFATSDLNKSLLNLLKHLIPENKAKSVAVGGGIIRGTKTFLQVNPTKKIYSGSNAFCIVFLQEKYSQADFNAFSCVIFGDDLSSAEFADELIKFKGRINLRNNSIAIRICCSGKTYCEEEPIIFKQHFPDTPLLGFSADGEIGWNCFLPTEDNDCGETKPKRAKPKYPKVQYQWSTVFVLLTWGPLQS